MKLVFVSTHNELCKNVDANNDNLFNNFSLINKPNIGLP
jgi:hypothetical protein